MKMKIYKLFHLPSSKFVRMRLILPREGDTNNSYRRLFMHSDISLTNESIPHLAIHKKYIFDILFKSKHFHMSMAFELGLFETTAYNNWYNNPVYFIRDEFDIIEGEIDEKI